MKAFEWPIIGSNGNVFAFECLHNYSNDICGGEGYKSFKFKILVRKEFETIQWYGILHLNV